MKMNQSLLLSLNKICRVCLKEDKTMVELFQNKPSKMFTFCTTIKLEIDDELPQLICPQCLEQIKQFYNFKKKCLESDEFLRQFFKEMKALQVKQEILENLLLSKQLREMETIDEEIVDLTENEQIDAPVNTTEVNDSLEVIEYDPVIDVPEPDDNMQLEVYDTKVDINTETVTSEDEEMATLVIEVHETPNEFNTKTTTEDLSKTTVNERRHCCNICNKTFEKKGCLIKHLSVHSKHLEEQFKCSKCKMEFTNSKDLTEHVNTHETAKITINCPKCDEQFLNISHFKSHVSQHLGEDRVTCTICDKSFLNTFQVKQHFVSHLREKPFACEICGQCFMSQYYLKSHVKKHNGSQPPLIC